MRFFAMGIGFAMVIAGLLAGCENQVSSLEVSPKRLEITHAQDTPLLSVVALDKNGNELEEVQVIWESSNPDVVVVDKAGAVSVKGSGRATVTVRLDDLRQEVPVKVDLCSSVKAESPRVALLVGDEAIPVVQALNEKGAPMECPLTWRVKDRAVASVDPMGRVKGISQGETVVTAACGGQTATVKVNVMAPPPPAPELVPGEEDVHAGDDASKDNPVDEAEAAEDKEEGDREVRETI